jgi:acetyl esterase/lipase
VLTPNFGDMGNIMMVSNWKLAWTAAVLTLSTPSTPAQLPPKVPDGVKALRDLEYVPGGHERQKLDLYLPEKTDERLPVIVWVHGGAWRVGSKNFCQALPFAAKGFAVASINYRYSQQAVFPAQIEDCKAAIRWLRANAGKYNLDPDHIGVWGSSSGGHLVSLLGTSGHVKELEGKGGNLDQSSKVQCVVDWYGHSDLRSVTGPEKDAKHPVGQLLGGPPSKNKDLAALASPVVHITKDCPPFLIMHGDKDFSVPFPQSVMLTDALKKANVPVTFIRVEGAGHGGKEFQTPEHQRQIEEFFIRYLKPSEKK